MVGYAPTTLYQKDEVEKMEEIWKDVEGFEGLYMVSNLGNVKSLNYRHKNEEHLLKLCINKYGYYFVRLHSNGMEKNFLVHRLVAKAFIENGNNFPLVNHKDENKLNNNFENLEWCTQEYNLNYSLNRRGKRNQQRKCKTHTKHTSSKYSQRVFQKKLSGEIVSEYSTVSEAARVNKMSLKSLIECCKKKRKTAYGYKWEFAD